MTKLKFNTNEEVLKYLEGNPELNDTIYFTNPDYPSAIIGITDDGRLIYDNDKMCESLVENNGMTYEEAQEWIDYNIGYYGNKTPIVLTLPYDEKDYFPDKESFDYIKKLGFVGFDARFNVLIDKKKVTEEDIKKLNEMTEQYKVECFTYELI